MNYKISCHLMPWELDYALLSFIQLKKSYYHLDTNDNDNVYVDVTLNLSSYLIDWDQSKIPKDFFISKFISLQPLLSNYKCKFTIYDGDQLFGGLNSMYNSIEPHIDYYMALNPDMYFSEHLLKLLIDSSKQIKNKIFIISCQIPKLWDHTWNIISHDNYKNIPYNQHKEIDVYEVRNFMKTNPDVKLVPINEFKFAGWMDLCNKPMWEYFMTQKGWNGYGSCDFYAMMLATFAAENKADIRQYILNNQLTIEYNSGAMKNSGYTKYYKEYICLKKIPNQREQFENNINTYLNIGTQILIQKNILK